MTEDQENEQGTVDGQTREAERADAARSHGADRPPSAEEERLAEEAATHVAEASVAEHEKEMDEIGADVKGEGAI